MAVPPAVAQHAAPGQRHLAKGKVTAEWTALGDVRGEHHRVDGYARADRRTDRRRPVALAPRRPCDRAARGSGLLGLLCRRRGTVRRDAGALLLRTAPIALGAAMLDAFSFTYLLFGIALTATAVQLFRHRAQDPAVDDNLLIAAARRRGLPPTLLALVAIATTDILFALDSIPAVFSVTDHAYIVFVANAFALLGLRALFFPRLRTARQARVPLDGTRNDSWLRRREAHAALRTRPQRRRPRDLNGCLARGHCSGAHRNRPSELGQDPTRSHRAAHAGSLRRPHDDARSRSTPSSATSPTAPTLTSPPGSARRAPTSTSKRNLACSLHSGPQLHE